MKEIMLKLKGIKKSFEGKTVLDGIDLEVKRGEVVAIIGPSGTGKSTLLRCINLLEMPDEGTVTIGELEVTAPKIKRKEQYDLRGQTSMVFQQYNLFANKTALENITEPLTRVKHLKKEEARRQGREILKVVGLTEKEKEYPSRMSGGQQQRVGIGRALATHPKVMLLDEPTASCIYTQKGNKKIRKPQAANQTALIFDRRAAARLLSINSIRRLCWS